MYNYTLKVFVLSSISALCNVVTVYVNAIFVPDLEPTNSVSMCDTVYFFIFFIIIFYFFVVVYMYFY